MVSTSSHPAPAQHLSWNPILMQMHQRRGGVNLLVYLIASYATDICTNALTAREKRIMIENKGQQPGHNQM